MWRLSLYRDDSETTVVISRVKHVFMTCGNTVLTAAVWNTDDPESGHFYLNYPRERIAWWRLDRTT
jgi:hypothetical protein